jgi:hypothetical protein
MTSTTAKVIADSVHPQVMTARITTFEVYAPRFLLAEINTHRVLARSAASSRAIPVKTRIEMVEADPFVPLAFGKNQPGMSADENLDDLANVRATALWHRGIGYALAIAEALEREGAHKQLANRVLEPYSYVHGVITATEWQNFWTLRLASNAQPEFQELAEKMRKAFSVSTPTPRDNHLPYTDDLTDIDQYGILTLDDLRKISASRCARISYTYHDGKPFDLQRDINRCKLLIDDMHMSPFDHVASVDAIVSIPTRSGKKHLWKDAEDQRQFWGWIPYRVQIEKETGYVGRRSSFDEIIL